MKDIKSIGDIRKLKKKNEKKLLRQKKQKERRKEFRESIKSDFKLEKFQNYISRTINTDEDSIKKKNIEEKSKRTSLEIDEFTMHKNKKQIGITENTYQDIDFGETTLQKLEKKFFRNNLIICSLAILIFCSIAYGIYITNSSAEVKKQVEVLSSEKYEQNFDTELKKFKYTDKEALLKFLEKKKLNYTLQELADEAIIVFNYKEFNYKISLDYLVERISIQIIKL